MNQLSKIGAFLVLLLMVHSCTKKVYTADIDTSYNRIGNWYKSDPEIDKMIAPYKQELDAQMDEVIAINPKEMKKSRPNSTLGNWFADAMLDEAIRIYGEDVDVAFQNYGGLRVPSLAAGDVTVGSIFELMPFDNKLVLLTLDGKKMKKLLDRIAEKGGWPMSHTISFRIDNSRAKKITIRGEKFDVNRSYRVALPDYIADGGDKCFFLKDAERQDNDLLIRDVIIQHLKSKQDKIIQMDNTLRIIK